MTVQERIPEAVRRRNAGLRIKEEKKQASHTEGLMSTKTHWRGAGVRGLAYQLELGQLLAPVRSIERSKSQVLVPDPGSQNQQGGKGGTCKSLNTHTHSRQVSTLHLNDKAAVCHQELAALAETGAETWRGKQCTVCSVAAVVQALLIFLE